MMDPKVKRLLSWMFAWVGMPLLFAGTVRLTYLVVRHELPGGHPADGVCLGILLAFVVGGTFLVRERLRPRAAWVVPVYAAVMGVLLFVVLVWMSLPFTEI